MSRYAAVVAVTGSLACFGPAAPVAAQPASPSEQSLPGAPQVRQQPTQGPTGGNLSPADAAPSEDTLPASPEQRQQAPAGPADQGPEKGTGLL